MKINYLESFKQRLNRQISYIAYDSPVNAKNFRNALKKAIQDIKNQPYKHRQSIYFDEVNVRDLIFKGYTIVYRVKKEESIDVFGFVKHQLSVTDDE